MANIKIKVGEYRVIDNGVVITHEGKDIIFEIDSLKIKVIFIQDSTVEGLDINFQINEAEGCLEIKLKNFGGIGNGVKVPLEIGTLNNEGLYLQFMTHSLNDRNAIAFEYTWLTKQT